MFDMINIFEVFLPQLLRYPNPTDPLNGEAAALLMREPKQYDAKVKGGFYFMLTLLTTTINLVVQSTCKNTQPKMQSKTEKTIQTKKTK
jgi:hypothetical protein